jgi:hypothetical protein
MRAPTNIGVVFLFALFALCGCANPGADRALVFSRTEQDLGSVSLGQHLVTFEIQNSSTTPRRILGVGDGCRGTACFTSRHRDVVTVGAGETYHYAAELTTITSGPFESHMELYVEDSGLRTVILTVRGVVPEPKP